MGFGSVAGFSGCADLLIGVTGLIRHRVVCVLSVTFRSRRDHLPHHRRMVVGRCGLRLHTLRRHVFAVRHGNRCPRLDGHGQYEQIDAEGTESQHGLRVGRRLGFHKTDRRVLAIILDLVDA